ncbi:MAG: hypothetical protein AAFZ67_11415, partial [Planctomycetota bacterium]
MSTSTDPAVRPSLVDAFEHFFGADIGTLSRDSVDALPGTGVEELVEGVDAFLEAAGRQEYPPEAVMADSLSDPVIIPDDRTEPRTTRRAKQVALAHREVVIPMQPLMIDYRLDYDPDHASQPIAALLEWTRRNELLVRRHVLSVTGRPSPFDVLGYDQARELVAEMVGVVRSSEFSDLHSRIVTPEQRGTPDEYDTIEAWMYGMLLDAVNAGSINANLTFLDADSGSVYASMAGLLGNQLPSVQESGVNTLEILQRIDLPAIDDIPDNEFVAIRMQSEDFEEFRTALGRVLAKTEAAAGDGADLVSAYKDSLDEIHVRADTLRRGIRDKAL